MSPALILIFSLYMISHATDFYKPLFVSVKSGERVTLNCSFLDRSRSDYVIWYRQRFGEIPQDTGERLSHADAKPSHQPNSSGAKVERIRNGISMTIPHAKKDDAGLYFCGLSNWEKVTFFSGTYLTVTDDEDVKVSVFQSGVSDWVPAGASVTLQCSVLSESRTAELQVFWFRAAPSQSHPQIIYTHHNSRHQCESDSSTHTCVYNMSKNILSLNDTGTYYCAVALCGKIIFGNGTRVQLENVSIDPVVIYLAVALGVCVVVIFLQAVFSCKGRNSEFNMRIQHGSVIGKNPNQSDDAVDLNYAALHFNQRKTKRTRRKKSEDCVYSEVIMSSVP